MPSDSSAKPLRSTFWVILRAALIVVSVALPFVLVLSAVQSYRAVGEMREVYLKNRAATIALQLELMPPDPELIDELAAEELDVASIRVFAEPLSDSEPDAGRVNAILSGQALYFSEEQRPVYRSYLPVHHPDSGSQFRVARIETYSGAADFLVEDALRHLTLTVLAAVGALATLGAYLLLLRRSARLEHLAQLGTMSAALAHEIRNPLGTIKGFVQLAREKSESAVASYLDTGLLEIGRLEKLVRELLLYARPPKPAIGTIAWSDVEARLHVPASSNGHGPNFRAEDGLLLLADVDSIVEILSNLIRNAAEAGPEGEVLVTASRDGSSVLVQVEDDGDGIAEEHRRRIFEPFFSTKASGTGLGLAISRALAQQMNAKLELLPRSPKGTTARLTLPAATAERGS